MKNFCAALIVLIIALLLTSCKKDNNLRPDLSAYTTTDSNCLFTGATDNSDWTYDAIWNAKENSLMNFSHNISTSDSLTGFVEVSPPCPNPNDGHFLLPVNTQKQCKMKVVLVNTEIETLYFSAMICNGGPMVNAYDFRALSSFHKNENYRMYYGFYNSKDSLYYKGHGDFRIE